MKILDIKGDDRIERALKLEEHQRIISLKLLNGDTIIGKTEFSPEIMENRGSIEMWDVLRIKSFSSLNPDTGGISEMLSFNPWIETMPIDYVVAIPLDTIVVISPVDGPTVRRYMNNVLAAVLKEKTNEEHEKKIQDIITEALDLNAPLNDDLEDAGTGEVKKPTVPFFAPSVEERKPERLTPDVLNESDIAGEVYEPDGSGACAPDSLEPSYKTNGVTIH
jgi:hypothetical protein